MISWRDYVPAGAAGRTFALTALISAVGTGLFLAGSAVFFVRSAGLTTGQVGVALAVAAAVGFLATVPIGLLADRAGAHRTLIVLQLWRAAWFVVLAFISGPAAFVVVASCLAAAEAATSPVTQSVVGALSASADRTRTMATVRTVRNVGFSLGALLAAPLVAADGVWFYRGIVLGNALAFVVSAALLTRLRVPAVPVVLAERPWQVLRRFRDWRYLCLTGLNGVLSLHMTVLSVGLPLWVITATSASGGIVPILIFVNTVLAVVLQVPFARGVERPRGAARALWLAGVSLALCCAALAVAGGRGVPVATGVLVVACVLLTFGELWQAAGGWELSYEHAPSDRRTMYLSVFSLGPTAQEIFGPPLVAGVVIAAGPPGWLGLAGLFLVAAVLVRPVVALLDRPGPVVPAKSSTQVQERV